MRYTIWVSYGDISKPVLIVDNKPERVIIRFIEYGAEHLTIHRKSNGILIRNLSLPNIAEPDLADLTTSAAKKRYKDWRKHLKYAFHGLRLRKLANENGYSLIAKYMNLNTFNPKKKYYSRKDMSILSPCSEFMLNLYLSTRRNPRHESTNKLPVALGYLCFEISQPIKKSR